MHRIMLTIALLLPITLYAQGWPPPVPQGGDGRVYIHELREDHVKIGVPYNYGMNTPHEKNYMDAWANWGCGLFQRQAVEYAFETLDTSCDEMGRAAAERAGHCWHVWHYACAVSP